MDSKQFISDLKNGQPDAFRKFVEENQHRVLNICYRFVHDKSEAEDLAQETFIEIHRSIRNFKDEANIRTWIHRIAVSKSIDFIRKQGRAKRGGKLKSLLRLDDKTIDIPASSSTGPDKVLEQQERRKLLQQALNTLPEKQRVAFVLSKYDGMSYQEIADQLKTSLSSVESLIHRAKKNLQKQLYNYYKE